MDQWLDSLSEDWVSQPRSPHSSSPLQALILRDSPSPRSSSSQSRIPRYKPRASSNLSTSSIKELRNPHSSQHDNRADGALKEKTPSNINASQKPNGQSKLQNRNSASTRLGGRHASTGSIPEVAQDTVQYKSSPIKERELQGTPDWKRRVLKENAGGDLFGPTSLESVFKPPTVKAKSQAKPTGKPKLFTKQKMSPSPTPRPMLSRRNSIAPTSSPRIQVPLSPQLQSRDADNILEETSQHKYKEVAGETLRVNSHAEVTARRASTVQSQEGEINVEHQTCSFSHHSSFSELPHQSMSCSPSLPTAGNSLIGPHVGEHSRTFSDKSRNENISPFFLSRQNTVDGRIEYAAVDTSMRRLRSQMDKMRAQQQNIPSSRSSGHGVDYIGSRPSADSALPEHIQDLTSQSLPDDLSMGTDTYAANGGFVSIRRGGYSDDGSFQRRPVSPSLLPDLDGPSLILPSSMGDGGSQHWELDPRFTQTKSKTPSSPPPSLEPQTPQHQKNVGSSSIDRPRSSGSPLKLFDKYDTFTNERLVRRMSKFEETLQQDLQDGSEIDDSNEMPSSPSPRRRRSIKQYRANTTNQVSTGQRFRVSSFGNGELNKHQFPAHRERSHDEPRELSEYLEDGTPFVQHNRIDVSQSTVGYKISTSEKRNVISRACQNRGDEAEVYTSSRKTSDENESQKEYGPQDSQDEVLTVTGKRLPYSPAKDPAPKRRRTLIASEVTAQAHTSLQEHLTAQEPPNPSISGRKRKDARYDDNRQAADPDTLAMRQIRQPKLPTSNWACLSSRPTEIGHDTSAPKISAVLVDSPLQLDQNSDNIMDPPTQIVAGALATIALNTAQEVAYGSRKASVTTADFFNEAQQIMQLIRAKGRPHSSHATTEGSEIGPRTILEESFVESTKDDFSRPPSREGSPRGLREPAKPNPRVISHLRKFKDDQELGLALSSSMKTLQIDQPRRQSQIAEPDPVQNINVDSHAESDPPNIRIRQAVLQNHRRKHSASTNGSSILETDRQNQSQDSQPTSAPSSGRSNPTGSSHSSTNRMVIAPETVAHLLSDQMAGMVFDRQKQLWVKRKSSPNVEGISLHDHTTSEATEEDFFGDIPDLSVDEMEELQRVKDAVSSVKSMGSAKENISIRDQAFFRETQTKAPRQDDQTKDSRPKTAEDKFTPAADKSLAPSKFSHFASSGLQSGTRATSWGDDTFSNKEPPNRPCQDNPIKGVKHYEEQVEHEISIFEGRESPTPKRRNNKRHQARVVTVAFSSPLVEHRDPVLAQGEDSDFSEPESELNLDDSPARHDSRLVIPAKNLISSGSTRNSRRLHTPQRMSIGNQAHHTRPMSRLDEEDEMSMVHYSVTNRHMSMEVALSTPLPMSRSLAVPPTSGGRSSTAFHLSPLPDFSVHQIDKAVDGDHGQITRRLPTRNVDQRLSLAAQDLVKNLTDLEPYEPYWDFIKCVDLRERELSTLHMLGDFCGRVEELDVSKNRIGELNGIPNTVRQLNIRDNCLSDLASWDFLRNLQYLDVSNNQISSLQGFQHLYHMRSLKMDDNKVSSLDGLEDLNGLTSLSLRDNTLKVVDFEDFDLQRLVKLDLHNNELVQISSLHQLPVLETCVLSDNELDALDFDISVPLLKLEHLDVSNNRLSFIDLAEVPNIKSLNLDRNSVASIESLNTLKDLHTLSWREQTLIPAYGFSEIQYQHCQEVRNLYLSGNIITAFSPSKPFLNLQSLELASTGLQSLSFNFGLMCPNLRTLNLNYNAVRDLRPLLGVVKLRKLSLAGNRISRLRRTAAVLDSIGNELSHIDLRNNTLTVGFYTPQESSHGGREIVPHKFPPALAADDMETRCADAFLLPNFDKEADNLSRERLDEDTKLRRRVYEMLVVNACKKLEHLDGLDVDRRAVGSRDHVWERLIELGVLKEKATATAGTHPVP